MSGLAGRLGFGRRGVWAWFARTGLRVRPCGCIFGLLFRGWRFSGLSLGGSRRVTTVIALLRQRSKSLSGEAARNVCIAGPSAAHARFSATPTRKRTERRLGRETEGIPGSRPPDTTEPTSKLGDEFTYRYKDVHYSKQRIVEVVAGKRIVWLILEAWLSFIEDKSEWNGTKVVFEVSKKGDETEVRFTHEGLVPQHECFDKCSNAWRFYVNESLRNLIATGKGRPNKKEQGTAVQQ